ncbi:MAG: hypothetical protein LBP87_14705 [Planctomycetaceae bacterium]|jgi:hypothetical protein|nr:hypothetical protein [Planctomycetaceae bacterium]
MNSDKSDLQEYFRNLAKKYTVTVPKTWRLNFYTGTENNFCSVWGMSGVVQEQEFVPFFPWRYERRFFELKQIVETKTIENVVLCRFSHIADGSVINLQSILYREFDLLEWITNTKIISCFFSVYENRFANVLVRLSDGSIASVEAGTTLPSGQKTLDRHELIARRGVTSDRVVDTHIPQYSVYLFDKTGVQTYTDTDAELFGLEIDETNIVRAAFDFAKQPESKRQEIIVSFLEQNRHLVTLTKQALSSETQQ